MVSTFNKEHIENQFISNPYWKKIFISKFPNWKPEKWTENSWSIFNENGYTYEIERCSELPTSKWYNVVKLIQLIDPNGEEIIAMRHLHISSALQQLFLTVILDFEVDFRTFK